MIKFNYILRRNIP